MNAVLSIAGWLGGLWPRVALIAGAVAVLVAWRASDVSAIRAAERARIEAKDRAHVQRAETAARKSVTGSSGVRDPYTRTD